tara:strand:+ start:316 stop:1104 length:789 start_codon:yes stop_codon:yes gene_type:complete
MSIDKSDLVKELITTNLKKICSIFEIEFDWNILEEFEKQSQLVNEINKCISKNNIFRTREFNSIYQFSTYRNIMYYLIRLLKPNCVVETGVMHGLTSAWILQALYDNKKGKLISIDLPRRDWKKFFPNTPMGPGNLDPEFELGDQDPGWIIPDYLRKNWDLKLGPSNMHLEKVLKKNSVDFFIHDSDHSYEIMSYECLKAFEIRPNSFFVIDNFDDNGFLFEYLSKNRVNYSFIDEVDDNRNISTTTAIMKLEEYILDRRNK